MFSVAQVDRQHSVSTHVTLGKHLKVGHKVVPGSDVLQHCEYFTRISPRLLNSAQYFLGSEHFYLQVNFSDLSEELVAGEA